MGPDERFCRFDNVPQDVVSVGAAIAANCRRHPSTTAGPRHTPVFATSYPIFFKIF